MPVEKKSNTKTGFMYLYSSYVIWPGWKTHSLLTLCELSLLCRPENERSGFQLEGKIW